MKKKVVAWMLMTMVSLPMIAGCGTAEEGVTDKDSSPEKVQDESDAGDDAQESQGDTEEEDLAEITVSWWSLGTVPDEENLALVEEAINEITEAEINTTVHLNIMDSSSYIPNGAMANGVANGEDFDVVLTAAALSGHYSVMQANGMLQPMNELLEEYAPELLQTVPEDFLGATTKNGEIYAIPSYCNKVQNMYWVCRNEVLKGADIDINSVRTIEDIDEALHKIKEAFPDMNALGGSAFSVGLSYPGYTVGAGSTTMSYDCMGEQSGVLAAVYFEDDSLTAVSRFETEDFKTETARIKSWYDAGLVDKDIATDSATNNPLQEKPTVASVFYTGQEDLVTALCEDTSYVKLASGVVSTGPLQQFTWAIPVSCDEPEASAKFLNLLFTDARIVDLFNYGVEGVHYEKKPDGTIGFPEGMTAETCGYYMGNITKLVGNGFLASVREGVDSTAAANGKEEMDQAAYSPLLGFSIDASDPTISDAYTQLVPIANQEYGPALKSGSAPEGYYEEFIDKLYDAGLKEYLDGVNVQIQSWLAEQ